jgi:hypothetical protein
MTLIRVSRPYSRNCGVEALEDMPGKVQGAHYPALQHAL